MLVKIFAGLLIATILGGMLFGWEKMVMWIYNNFKVILAVVVAALVVGFFLNKDAAKGVAGGLVSFAGCIVTMYILFVWAFSGKFPWFK